LPPPEELDRVQHRLLLHLLEHHGQQVRFEASQWVTEFGIIRRFSDETPESLRQALRALEMARLAYRRTQYVVGYSEPKHVYALTPSGHRKALEVREASATGAAPAEPPAAGVLAGPASRPPSAPDEAPPSDDTAEPTV
jgi:DNA-binding PadR family transcriptional regulator